MLIALALASVLASHPGEAGPGELGDPDGVVTTAPRGPGSVLVGAEAPTSDARPEAAQVVAATPHNLTTREQIDRWVSARADDTVPFAQDRGPVDDREMHGFVSAGIGTGDYNSVAVGVSLPVGENGRLDLAYSQSNNDYGFGGYGYGYPGYGYPAGYDYGRGYRSRPWGAYDSFGASGRSRSMSVGFSWDASRDRDRDREEGGPLRTPGIDALR